MDVTGTTNSADVNFVLVAADLGSDGLTLDDLGTVDRTKVLSDRVAFDGIAAGDVIEFNLNQAGRDHLAADGDLAIVTSHFIDGDAPQGAAGRWTQVGFVLTAVELNSVAPEPSAPATETVVVDLLAEPDRLARGELLGALGSDDFTVTATVSAGANTGIVMAGVDYYTSGQLYDMFQFQMNGSTAEGQSFTLTIRNQELGNILGLNATSTAFRSDQANELRVAVTNTDAGTQAVLYVNGEEAGRETADVNFDYQAFDVINVGARQRGWDGPNGGLMNQLNGSVTSLEVTQEVALPIALVPDASTVVEPAVPVSFAPLSSGTLSSNTGSWQAVTNLSSAASQKDGAHEVISGHLYDHVLSNHVSAFDFGQRPDAASLTAVVDRVVTGTTNSADVNFVLVAADLGSDGLTLDDLGTVDRTKVLSDRVAFDGIAAGDVIEFNLNQAGRDHLAADGDLAIVTSHFIDGDAPQGAAGRWTQVGFVLTDVELNSGDSLDLIL